MRSKPVAPVWAWQLRAPWWVHTEAKSPQRACRDMALRFPFPFPKSTGLQRPPASICHRRLRSLETALRQRQPRRKTCRNQVFTELFHGRKLNAMDAKPPCALDIFQFVIQKNRLFGSRAHLLQPQPIDRLIGLDHTVLVAPDERIEVLDPGELLDY